MEVIIHIGSTKTGSSALQNFFFENRIKLYERGVVYPDIGIVSGAHHLLGALFHQNAWNLHKNQLGSDLDLARARFGAMLSAKMKDNPNKRLLLSSEYLWTAQEPKRFVSFLRERGAEKVRVVCYIREITAWLQSQYNQAVKGGADQKFSPWMRQTVKSVGGGANYNAILDGWSDAIGGSGVTARGYSDATLPDGLFSDFLAVLGLTTEGFNTDIKEGRNPSPIAGEMEILAALNGLSLPSSEKATIRSFLLNIAPQRSLFQEFDGLSREDIMFIETNLLKGLERVRTKYLDPSHGDMPLFIGEQKQRTDSSRMDDIINAFLRISIGLLRRNGS